ncbi:MAG: YibE/F family protein [Patescibacteria group bacterium]|nr:YibE/F family protein [Patescibacteria group bacterium]
MKYLFTGVLLTLFATLLPSSALAMDGSHDAVSMERAVVLDIYVSSAEKEHHVPSALESFLVADQLANYTEEESIYKLKLLTGDQSGEEIEIYHNSGLQNLTIHPEVGDTVSVYVDTNEGVQIYSIQDYFHLPAMFWFALIVFVLIARFGGWQGVRGIGALILSLSFIFYVLVPAISSGVNPLFITFGGLFLVALVNITFILGFNKKSLIAVLGTMFGMGASAIAMNILGYFAHLNALTTEDLRRLMVYAPNLDLTSILYAGILIGAIGAVIDVAVSITAAIDEVRKQNPDISRKEIVQSGMKVGRDIIGAMVDTLVYAYTGSAFALILLFAATQNIDLVEILNLGYVANELARALIGAFALVLTIPATAYIAGFIETYTDIDFKDSNQNK